MARIQRRRSISLAPARYLQLQALAERRCVSMAAWLEEVIGARAAAEDVVVLPEDVERFNRESQEQREAKTAATESERERFFG